MAAVLSTFVLSELCAMTSGVLRPAYGCGQPHCTRSALRSCFGIRHSEPEILPSNITKIPSSTFGHCDKKYRLLFYVLFCFDGAKKMLKSARDKVDVR